MTEHPTFHFSITTPERTLFSAEVEQVSLPTPQGSITVLPHHMPLVSLLAAGELRIKPRDGEEKYLAVSGGCIEVQGDRVVVLADTAEHAEELDEAKIQ